MARVLDEIRHKMNHIEHCFVAQSKGPFHGTSLSVAQSLANMEFSFPSGFERWDRQRFEAYAKLLGLKNGGQIEEASDFKGIADEEEESSESDSAASENVEPSSQFNENKLKRAFLDRLSELIANEKGGHHVSASLMIEWPDRVDILVAKNTGFKEKDPVVQLLEAIESSLRDISRLDCRGLSNMPAPLPFTESRAKIGIL